MNLVDSMSEMSHSPAFRGILLTGAATIGVFALGFPLNRMLAHWGIVDRPNERSSHARPTTRGGGIAILMVILLSSAVVGVHAEQIPVYVTMVAAVVALAAVSFADDLRSLPPLFRFGCHTLAAISVLWALGGFSSPLGLAAEWSLGLPRPLGLGLALLGIVGYTNAFNFMDGINGIAAGQAALTGLGMGLLSGMATGHWSAPPDLFCFILAGASLGFLPHNFPTARMFMGDVGSAPLGFLLSVMVLWLAKDQGWWLLAPLGLLHANFVLDTGITLVRRVFGGERWYEAHREHFYQRLVRAGKGHTLVTLLEMGLQCVVLGLLTLYIYVGASVRLIIVVAVIMIWLSFFAWAESCFARFLEEPDQAASVKLPTAP